MFFKKIYLPISFAFYFNLNDIICGHVRTFVMLSIIFWITYLLGLVLNYIDTLLVFPWVLIVPHLLRVFCFVMRESLSDKNQSNSIEALNSTSRYCILIILFF